MKDKIDQAKRTLRKRGISTGRRPDATGIVRMSSTDAQNRFGHVLSLTAKNSAVMITKHETVQAVVISADRYRELTDRERPDLDRLTAEFDAMYSRMQSPESTRAVQEAFNASPTELGAAAIAAKRRVL